MAVVSDNIGQNLLRLFGLPDENCRSLNINFTAGKIVTVSVEYFPKGSDLENLEMIIKEYVLVEK